MNEHLAAAALRKPGAYWTESGRPQQRACALTRGNAPIFYSLGAASLLEALASSYAEQALSRFAACTPFCEWLEQVWGPQHAARLRVLRDYMAVTWPEFDWKAAKEKFAKKHVFLAAANSRARPAEQALTGCVAVSQSALFYRCVSRWADDASLRRIAQTMADEDAASFDVFRGLFETFDAKGKLGPRAAWRTVTTAVRKARDIYVQDAFDALVLEWGPNAPFLPLSYPDFVARAADAIEMHAPLGWRQRMIFKAWRKAPRALVASEPPRRVQKFTPVLPDGERAGRARFEVSGRWHP